jgi:exopolysaccharide biosynthesis protein
MLDNAWQIWSFGPALVKDAAISVRTNTEIQGRNSPNGNPRTAIGMIEPLHYIVIVSNGRMADDEGLSLYQLAELFSEHGCSVAYNLDGGGSSTMVYEGELINKPTTNGRTVRERSVNDIIFVR